MMLTLIKVEPSTGTAVSEISEAAARGMIDGFRCGGTPVQHGRDYVRIVHSVDEHGKPLRYWEIRRPLTEDDGR